MDSDKDADKSNLNQSDNIVDLFYDEKNGSKFYSNARNIKNLKEQNKYFKEFELEQGDILINFPDNFIESEYFKPFALIIGTYTCDIPKKLTSRIHLIPIYPLNKLILELLRSFIETTIKIGRKDEIKFKDFNANDSKCFSTYFNKFNREEKDKYIEYIKSIFQFKNRNFFLICPHKEINNLWCFIDIQMIHSIEKEKIYPEIIKYVRISISSPWKEKFGSVLGSRFDKVAVDHFTNKQIKEIIVNQLGY